MKKWIVIVVLFVAVGWVITDYIISGNSKDEMTEKMESTGLDNDSNLETGLKSGMLAPDFELKMMDGEILRLSDLRGEKVLLNFWATWCPPCRAEMPDMQRYYDEVGDGVIVAVNLLETETNMADVEDFLNEFNVSFPIPLDESTNITANYEAFALPTSYFINTDGTIDAMAIGALNYDMLVEQFDSMD
ncbi:TlpA family protein disulfide reductase [Oceanobacillus sp. CAU 1775]